MQRIVAGEQEPTVSGWALAHARELATGGPPIPPGKVEVELLTDPWSVWCWGFEPVRRALEHRYPTVMFRHRVGGMFPTMPDPAEMGFDVERFFGVVQRTTGMPIRLDATRRDRPTSTYPACIHWQAVRLVAPHLAPAYLRRMREAVYFDGRNVSRPEVAAEVAAEVGVPRDEFEAAIASGEPERDFRQTMAGLEAENLHAYPTFIVRAAQRAGRVEGFQTLPGLMSIVERVSGRLHPARPPPEPLDVLTPGDRVATREVAEACGTSVEEAYESLDALAKKDKVERERHPTGDAWRML